MRINPKTYIYPPRPNGCTPRGDYDIYSSMGWVAQLKFNDSRTLIKILDSGVIQLWNRHAKLLKYSPSPELRQQLEEVRDKLFTEHGKGYYLLDGGVLHQKHKAIKHTVVIWDILVFNGEYQLGTEYNTRYKQVLELATATPYVHTDYQLGLTITPDILVPQLFVGVEQWDKAWELVDSINKQYLSEGCGPLMEGLVFKDPSGALELGLKEKNNQDWSTRSRVETGRHRF